MIIEEENKNESLEKQNKNTSSTDRLIYDDVNHLNELIKEILAYHEKDGVDNFEQISMYIKRKMTKLSFQYSKAQRKVHKSVELTEYEQKIIVNLK